MRVANNMIFSNLDSWKSGLQQAKDNSKHIFNQNVNAAKTFEHNSREINQQQQKNVNAKDNDANNIAHTTTTYFFTQKAIKKSITLFLGEKYVDTGYTKKKLVS